MQNEIMIWDKDRVTFARIDGVTGTLQAIEFEHHEIHDGDHFFYSDCIALASSATQDYMLTVPNDNVRKHFTFGVTGSGSITIAFFEGTDKTGTTAQTIYNNDRDSTTTPGLTVHKGTSGGSTDGTDIHPDCGGANKQTGVIERQKEIILKTNTKYIMRITSGSANNNIATHFDWYEHIDTV